MRATPKRAVTVVSKPGFRDGAKGFVMPMRKLRRSERSLCLGRQLRGSSVRPDDQGRSRAVSRRHLETNSRVTFPELFGPGRTWRASCQLRRTARWEGRTYQKARFPIGPEVDSGKTTLSRLRSVVLLASRTLRQTTMPHRGVSSRRPIRATIWSSFSTTPRAQRSRIRIC